MNETTDGTDELPSVAGSTRAWPSLTTATQLLEVPRSIPTTALAICNADGRCTGWAGLAVGAAHRPAARTVGAWVAQAMSVDRLSR